MQQVLHIQPENWHFFIQKLMQKGLNPVLWLKWLRRAKAEDDLSDLVDKAWYYFGQYHKI